MEDPEVLRAAEDDQVPLAGVQHLGQGRTAQGARLQRHQVPREHGERERSVATVLFGDAAPPAPRPPLRHGLLQHLHPHAGGRRALHPAAGQ